jgi:serine/threonine protein kinase
MGPPFQFITRGLENSHVQYNLRMLQPGQQLLHYCLIEKIGEGGMGVVWRAVDTTLDREVAIKLLPEKLAADPERLARFEREAKVLASLNHPNLDKRRVDKNGFDPIKKLYTS